ncbi:MAG: hypothetical protein IJ973_02040, partial [Christensenellaceae bacterium]|nr:hypothetical protein [Christensenellaceae bacterium]
KEALRAVGEGRLGKIISVEAQMNCKHARGVREWLECFPGGMLFFLGCHLVDLIYQIQGEPKEIIPLSCSSGIDGLSTRDFGMAVFVYENGVSFAKTCDNERGGFLRRQLVICGEKGSMENIRGSFCRSALLQIYDDDTMAVFFRNHDAHCFTEVYFPAKDKQTLTIPHEERQRIIRDHIHYV